MERTRQSLVQELHKPARHNYPRRAFDLRDIDETWQADLVEMIPYAQQNKGFKYMLTVIDIFSKFAWAQPLKSKGGKDVATAMRSVLEKSGRVPKNLQTDQGREFYNKDFQNLMKEFKINLYSTYSNMKASICERFNRTLKSAMWKNFSLNGNYKWINILPDLLDKYNSNKHRTIQMRPKDVTASNVEEILRQIAARKSIQYSSSKLKFKVGDKVRINKNKQIFEKGYTPNWSTEIFTIDRIVGTTEPFTYHLKDYQSKPIAGGFYKQELLKTKYPDVYLIEKVLKKRGDQVFVKWLGFDNSHNSWINKNDM